jgi:hypothetical protein
MGIVLSNPDAPTLEQTLESAVIVSCADLMTDLTSGLLHFECAFAPDNSIDYLKLWFSATRGQWRLACAYWTASSAFHDKGIHFENGFRSDRFSENLEFIMQHQNTFSPSVNRGRTSLLKIQEPSVAESEAATELLKLAFGRANAIIAPPTLGDATLAIP